MARKRTKMRMLQLPIDMVECDALLMSDEEWDAAYRPIFGTRARARATAEIHRRNRRPFIIVPVEPEIYDDAMKVAEALRTEE